MEGHSGNMQEEFFFSADNRVFSASQVIDDVNFIQMKRYSIIPPSQYLLRLIKDVASGGMLLYYNVAEKLLLKFQGLAESCTDLKLIDAEG